jgi:YHS domain-containing protein
MSNQTLAQRIQNEFDSHASERKHREERKERESRESEARLKQFEQLCADLKEVWGPKLDTFAKQFGDKIKVTPEITPSHREAKVAFLTDLANMTMTISASASPDVRDIILDYELLIVPTFIQYDRHARLAMPIDKVDREAIGQWVDDQLVACVKAYLAMQDNQQYLSWSMVQDPITRAKLLRQDAAGTLEHEGKTLYFSSVDTLRQYKERHGIAP